MEIVKRFILDTLELCFKNALKPLEKQYCNPHRLLINKIRDVDVLAYGRLFNFQVKCQSLNHFPSSAYPLDSPDMK